MPADPVQRILSFWFELQDRQAWFEVDTDFDERIRAAFEPLVVPATAGTFDLWATTPDGSLALLLVLDQFPRNIFRGTPRAFASDAKAREVARDAIAAGIDQRIAKDRRPFVYLPFEHSERLEDQDLCCRLMATVDDESMADYARRHREIIARFGRFPHRNRILGRISTAQEAAFLQQPDSSF